uniref:Uncharacterized protein n=1 Tax=Bursaphelenchus xylophilus TaxID=6326 RepID=A0A1I7RYA7_BURXY
MTSIIGSRTFHSYPCMLNLLTLTVSLDGHCPYLKINSEIAWSLCLPQKGLNKGIWKKDEGLDTNRGHPGDYDVKIKVRRRPSLSECRDSFFSRRARGCVHYKRWVTVDISYAISLKLIFLFFLGHFEAVLDLEVDFGRRRRRQKKKEEGEGEMAARRYSVVLTWATSRKDVSSSLISWAINV